MGILSSLSSAGKAIKSGASSLKSGASSLKGSITDAYNDAKSKINNKGLLGTNYRMGVLNDFSIVTKAVFHVLSYHPNGGTGKDYILVKSLPVQINPDHLYHVAKKTVSRANCISGGTSGRNKFSADGSSFNDSIDIRVIYDIYDDYVAAGEITGKNISLFNRDYTSLPELIDLTSVSSDPEKSNENNANLRVIFKWGEIEHFGMLTGASVDYTAFSRWGNPLKAEATFTMAVGAMPEQSGIQSARGFVDSYTLLSDASNAMALVGLKGAEELGGLALGVVQSLRT